MACQNQESDGTLDLSDKVSSKGELLGVVREEMAGFVAGVKQEIQDLKSGKKSGISDIFGTLVLDGCVDSFGKPSVVEGLRAQAGELEKAAGADRPAASGVHSGDKAERGVGGSRAQEPVDQAKIERLA